MGPYSVILIPAVGGLLVGPLVTHFAPEAKGHGVPEVLKAIAIKRGKIRPVVVIVKALASILSLGSGASVGREGPIVQVGAAIGSTAAQVLGLNLMRTKNLIACGAAAGIAAVFNAPIAGVMFASEVILRDFSVNNLRTIVVAAVSASIISHSFLGEFPAFSVPPYRLQSPWEIIVYLILGVLSAFAAVAFIWSLHKSEAFWERVKSPGWCKPALGGLLVGLIGVYFPQVFSSGFSTIEDALHGNVPLFLLLMLIFLKIAATAISIGSGSSGGVFAPALFIGAVLGGSVGRLLSHSVAFPMENSGAYALVGMACVFAACAHAPVTAILIVFEMTSNYHLILPIMAAVVVATSVSQFLHRDSIYTVKLKQQGIDIGFLEEARILGGLQVGDAMGQDFETALNTLPAQELIAKFSSRTGKTVFVTDAKGNITGMIDYQEVQRFLFEDNIQMILVDDVALPVRERCFATDPLSDAALQMASSHVSHLPVMDPETPTKVVGVLHSEDILRVYSNEILRRTEIEHRAGLEGTLPEDVTTVPFVISPSSQLVNKLIRDVDLPPGIRFNSVKRGKKLLIPHGEMPLCAKDRIWAVLPLAQREDFQRWLKLQERPSVEKSSG
ncbi:MAG: chloride channel protein [Candidatus Omnitrophota bacterium]|nr:chloride channel protein [Candidatus Omnitrophota bacterium]